MFAALDARVSPTILLQGDSTNNDDTDWVYRWLVEKLGPAKLWDDTSSRYGGWSTLQAGSAGQRYIQFDGATKCNIGALWQRHDVRAWIRTAFMRAVAAGGSLSTLGADGVHPSAGAGVDIWVNEIGRVARQRVSY